MAIFTTIAAAIGLTGFFASAFVTVASIATSIGLSYVAKALAGDPADASTPAASPFSIQGTLQTGGDVPRSFNLGYSSTAGSLAYANTWGVSGETPNAYFTQVIALADLPGGDLVEVWINGELCTLGGTPHASYGYPVTEYNKDGADHLWVKYYDGTQTTADSFLTGTVASVDRPYASTRVGTGVAYVICTSLVNDTLFTGFPSFRFAVSGIPLYDPTKDSTNGGSGAHRWSDSTTWGGDGDDFPAVQAYNVLRGIYHNGVWLYGLQRMTAARLPATNWNAQIAKCRTTITGASGAEATYRTGGQVTVDTPIVRTIEALLTGCQGRLSEVGGFYKVHIGAPDSPTFSFTDDDILSTEEQNFAPFFGLADSINGITATYPSPAEGWNAKVAPPLYSPDHEAEDGDRRLLANPTFDFVPYDAQVQRLQKSALLEARRARRHAISLPPEFWIVEPGDVGEWTSTRNGYVAKQFRVDGVTDKANLDVLTNLTEVDSTDYDWTHSTDYTVVTTGPTVFPRPDPQGVVDWFAEPWTLYDTATLPRRPAIRLSWDGNLPGVVGVQYEVRLASTDVVVTRGRTDQLAVGSIIISQSLLPDTAYEARGQYLPSAPRDMLWSDWLAVTTPDILLSLLEFDAALTAQVTTIQDAINDRLDEIEQRFATMASKMSAQDWLSRRGLRDQTNSIRESLVLSLGEATADIEEVRTVAVGTEGALATFETSVTASFATTNASVNTNATAIATLNSSFSSYQTSVNASLGSLNSSVTTNSSAIATLDGYAAARYSVTLDVNGYASGFTLLNGGTLISSATFLVDKFQIASPGVSGGSPVPIFTVGNVSGSPKIGIRGDMFVDGTITASMIATGAITAIKIAAGAITADKITAGSIDTAALAINSVSIDKIIAGAVTQETFANYSAFTGIIGVQTIVSTPMTITGGTASVECDGSIAVPGNSSYYTVDIGLYVDGVLQKQWTWSPYLIGGNYVIQTPFTLNAYVTGLSAGSHTFDFRTVPPGVGGFFNYGAGYIRIQNLRR